jgi:hypothetical protein
MFAVNINEIKEFLLLCVILNYVLLLIWAGVFIFAHDWMYKMHGRWFRLSAETFDAIHYKGMAIYKIGIILFNLAPLAALCLM